MSHDGGQSGNLFAGHYFDFNRRHTDGTLMDAVIGRPAIELKEHTKLVLKPLSAKKVESLESQKKSKHRGEKKDSKEEF